MTNPSLAGHEMLEVHETLNFKTICLMRSKLMQGLCFDNELKALMQRDVQQSADACLKLQALYDRFPVRPLTPVH